MKRTRPDPDQLPLPFRIDVNKLLFRRFGISTHAKHLLRIMCSLLGAKPVPVKHIFKSQAAFADAMEVTVRIVEHATAELKKRGLVYKDRRPRKGLMCTTWGLRTAVIWELAGVNLIDPICEPTPNTCGSICEPTPNTCGSICEPTPNTCGSIQKDMPKSAEKNDFSAEAHYVNHRMVLNKIEPMNHGNHGDDGKTDDGAFKKSEKKPIQKPIRKTIQKTVRKWIDRQLTACDLADADVIGDLFDHAVASKAWPAGEHGEHEFFALCVHCSEAADNPGAMLTAVVFLGKTAKPTNGQELQAEKLLLQRGRKQHRPQAITTTVAARVAESMTPPDMKSGAPVKRSYQETVARLKELAAKDKLRTTNAQCPMPSAEFRQ